MQSANKQYDLIIVGGGLVGNSLLLALKNLPIKIAVIEKNASNVLLPKDFRAIALSQSSKEFYSINDFWESLSPNCASLRKIHVSVPQCPFVIRINANECSLPSLGEVIEADTLKKHLFDSTSNLKNVDWYYQSQVVSIKQEIEAFVKVIQDNNQIEISAPLIIAADGSKSKIRELLKIETKTVRCEQQAIVATIELNRKHDSQAYERFSSSGPMVLLPLKNNYVALVACLHQKTIDIEKLSLSNYLLQYLQKSFGYRLGKLVGINSLLCYPISPAIATSCISSNVILLGDAAYTLHPVGAQGFNMALRDIRMILKHLNIFPKAEWGTERFLKSYVQQRNYEHDFILKATAWFSELFCERSIVSLLTINSGMGILDRLPWLKKQFVRMISYGNYPFLNKLGAFV